MVVKQGLDAYETYQSAKPALFWGGIIGAIASGLALAKRRRTAEAYPLYVGTFIASCTAIWLGAPSAASRQAKPGDQPSTGIIAALDAKRAAYAAADPRWADKIFARLAAQPDVAAQLQRAPAIRALLS